MTPIPTSSCEQRDTLEVMDIEIQRIDAASAGFKERRNNLLPLFRLPIEVLTDILYRCLYCLLKDYASPVSATLASLLRVSRRIRSLTLSCRKLWSLVDFRSQARAEKMLSLAGTAPLVIRAEIPAIEFYGFLDEVPSRYWILGPLLENVQRFRELHIRAPYGELTQLCATMDKFRPTTIPLVSLQIHCVTDDPLDLPKYLVNSTAPELSEVKIYGAQMPLDSPLLGNALRHLELFGEGRGSGTLKTVSDGLRNFPNLHTLILQNHLLLSSPQEMKSLRKVQLPRLAYLALTDGIECCAQLLELVEVKYPTHIKLECEATLEQELLLHPFLASFSQDGERGWIGTLSLTGHGSGSVESIIACPIEPPRPSVLGIETQGRAPLSVRLMYPHPYEVGDAGAAGALCSRMRLNRVHTLTIINCHNWSAEAWRRGFQQCIGVKHLVVTAVDFDGFTAALFAGTGVEDQLMMRNLECISLQRVRAEDESYSENLCNMLIDRSYHDIPVQELRLSGCSGFTERDRRLLQNLVPKLVWDRPNLERDIFGDSDSDLSSNDHDALP